MPIKFRVLAKTIFVVITKAKRAEVNFLSSVITRSFS